MRCLPALASLSLTLCLAGSLAACSPTYNWREVRMDGADLQALLPCKPDHGARRVDLGGNPVEMRMQGCEADGSMFTIAWVDAADAARAGPLLSQWKTQTLATLRATKVRDEPIAVAGADAAVPATRVALVGQQADGSALAVRVAWFARGAKVMQVMQLTNGPDRKAAGEAAETFFSGLRLS
ncbi:hypothetical protein ACO2Q9_07355 [Variovorax sp. VNK109]|uniref:hypothetical protein n=1 Tax=Variovorax sp. VNK109 TaxID=3400919 RepID=UPI003BFFC280